MLVLSRPCLTDWLWMQERGLQQAAEEEKQARAEMVRLQAEKALAEMEQKLFDEEEEKSKETQ